MVNIEQPLAGEASHMLREMLQNKEHRFQDYQSGNTTNMMQECNESPNNSDSGIVTNENVNDIPCDHSERSGGSIDGSDEESSSLEQSRLDEAEMEESKYDADEEKYSNDNIPEAKEAKKARLENIITSVQNPCPYTDQDIAYGLSDIRRPKRKQFYPQQHESNAKIQKTDGHFDDDLWQLSRFSSMQNYFKHLNETAKHLNGYSSLNELHRIQQAYLANLSPRASDDIHTNNNIYKSALAPPVNENRRSSDDPFSIAEQVREKVNSNKGLNDKVTDLDEKELQLLISNLKSKIEEAVSATVDKELNKFFQKRNNELKQDEQRRNNFSKELNTNNHDKRSGEQEKKTTDHSLDHILQMPVKPPSTNGFQLPGRHSAFELPKLSGRIPDLPRPPFPPPPPPIGYPPLSFYLPTNLHPSSLYSCPLIPPEQTEALSLVVNTPQKKKRTKVTDTRLSPRAARALLQENGVLDQDRQIPGFNPMTGTCLPTSVAIPNPSLQQSDILNYYKEQAMCRSPLDPDRNSPSSSHSPDNYGFMKGDFFNDSESFDPSGKITDTLTPMHLRKAKLMFFYVRYPSSAIIKVYFPDVQFNKNNTAQLVKWFSNFREFYYIQMEKYARQAIAEGCKHAEDLVVNADSELYRVLNLHYNRNNQIDVPDHFRAVVQATLREFFVALVNTKDTEPSWKKPIYKVIARMDDVLPEYFKSPNWMDQLGDA